MLVTENLEAAKQFCIDKNNLDGKYLVLAGPGTGKTYTVIKRLQALIDSGVNPERILCLTYTVAAADEMKKRVLAKLSEDNNNIEIHTYHSFCNKIIGEYSEEFELPNNFRVINDTMKLAFLKECIDELANTTVYYKSSKTNPYTHLSSISDGINSFKHHRINSKDILEYNIKSDPDWGKGIEDLIFERDNNPRPRVKYENKIKTLEEKIEKIRELYKFYSLYTSKMEINGYIDFDDMINNILEKFEASQDFAEKIANKYDYIIIDEYQDTNKSQNELIFHLVDNIATGNVFVVGDDEQIVNASQGARLDSIETFLLKYPEIKKPIRFTENRRSTQIILDVARMIADQNPMHLTVDRTLIAVKENLPQNKVRMNIYTDFQQQNIHIVEEIDNLINSEACPKKDVNGTLEKDYSQIAILSTNKDELKEFAELLHNRNIPYELKEGKNIFEIKPVIILYYYLLTLVNPELYSDKLFKLLLLPPFSINPESFLKLYKRCSMDKTFIDTMRKIVETDNDEDLNKFLTIYDELKKLSESETVFKIVTHCAAKTGILETFLNTEINQVENILGLQTFLNEAASFSEQFNKVTLEEFTNYLEMAQAEKQVISADKESDKMNAVQLTTYQSSKGKEYEYVYMPSLQKSKWESNSRPPIKPTIPLAGEEIKSPEEWSDFKMADKINKLYVGMTRAKHTLRLSYVAGDGSAAHTQFIKLNEIPKTLIEINELKKEKKYDIIYQAQKAWTVKDYDYKRDFKSRINHVLEDFKYAPTYVNDYIKCPRLFFYNQILNLAPAHGIADYASFGSAVHKACEDATNYAIKNKKYYENETPFLESFKTKLDSLPLSSFQVRTHLEETGAKKLKEFYNEYFVKTPIDCIYSAEESILTEFEGVSFKGKIDRIDLVDGKFIIYDYKTGKTKNESVICPQGEHEDYYIQMGLYKYFLEKTNKDGIKVAETIFVFPEEHNKPCKITYTDEMMEEILTKYRKAIKGIRSHEFEPTPSENSCLYCPYKTDICFLAK